MKICKIFNKFVCFSLVICLGVVSLVGCGDSENGTTDATNDETQTEQTQTENQGEVSEFTTEYTATDKVQIEIQDYGIITVELDGEKAPITVANFKKLIESGFYNGLTLHRIMKDFMMQGGDPQGTGMGGSDEQIKGEFADNGVNNPLSHTRGAISMARASYSMDSASSQFFICHKDSTFLDGSYACFGYVTEGMDVVDKICTDAQPTDNNGTIPKENQPIITSMKIVE